MHIISYALNIPCIFNFLKLVMNKPILSEKGAFLIRNILKGFLYLAILVLVFFLIQKSFTEQERLEWFGEIYNNPVLVLSVYVGSEVLFGIIPPEVFMLWSLKTGYLGAYFFSIGILSVISYAAGLFNYTIGGLINHKSRIGQRDYKIITKYRDLFLKYGAHLVVVASVSPIPFSAISLLAGAGGLERNKYLLFSLFRIVRFFVYAYIIWKIEA